MMPFWQWIGALALAVWCAWQLWRAATLGKSGGGVVDIGRQANPIWFWFNVGIHALLVIMVGIVGIGTLIHALWRISS